MLVKISDYGKKISEPEATKKLDIRYLYLLDYEKLAEEFFM